MSGSADMGDSEIARFFDDSTVLITGATGFLGKVILEKLLRSCSRIRRVYVLIRSKRQSDAASRLQTILQLPVFQRVKPANLSKVVAIQGDMNEDKLGLSREDRETLINEVSVVIHSAATVRFNEPLRTAVKMNIVATKDMITLCNSMQNLRIFVHVSTCYCNCDRDFIEERVYPQECDPDNVVQTIDWLDDGALDTIQPSILGRKPNTYTFTKSLAELIVQYDRNGNYPVAIVRPSIIVGSWKEPFPGWVDNFNGPTGLTCAVGCGLLRSIHANPDCHADMVPVDTVANTVLAAAWNVVTQPRMPNELRVFNCCSRGRVVEDLKWGDIERIQKFLIERISFQHAVRYPSFRMHTNSALHRSRMWLQHFVPACVGDMVFRLVGKPTALVKTYYKLDNTLDTLSYFTTHEWVFDTKNMDALAEALTSNDKNEFSMDLKELDWKTFFYNYVEGARNYLLKEPPCNKMETDKRNRRLYMIDQAQNFVAYFALWHVFGMSTVVGRCFEYLSSSLSS